MLAVGIGTKDPAARRQPATCVPAWVLDAWDQDVFAIVGRGNRRFRVVTADDEQASAVGRHDDGVRAVFAGALELAHQSGGVEFTIVVLVGQFVEAGALAVDDGVDPAEGLQQTLRSAELDGHAVHRRGGAGVNPIETSPLVGSEQAAVLHRRERDPRAELLWHREQALRRETVEQLQFAGRDRVLFEQRLGDDGTST